MPASLELLLARHGLELARHLRRIVRDDAAAEDLLQDTFLRAHQALGRLEEGANTRAWLYRIATNVALNHVRDRSRERRALDAHAREATTHTTGSGHEPEEARRRDLWLRVASLLRDYDGRPVLEGALDQPRRALDRYFSGRSFEFGVAFDLSELSPFDRKVLEATARIPAGRVKTYTDVAKAAGNARASRAAGNALHKNPVAIIVPCHRVLRSDGSLGGYGGGLPVKEWLLRHEGAIARPML